MRLLNENLLHILSHCLLFLLIHSTHSRECNHELWDDSFEGKVVKRIRTDCNNGKVRWHAPYGGLYLTIDGPQFPHQLCLQIHSLHTAAYIYSSQTNKLTKLLSTESSANHNSAKKLTRCFPVVGSQAFYMEATSNAPVSSEVVLEYDIEADTRSDECMPCTDEELMWHYCASNFVVIGHMTDLKSTAASSVISVSVDAVKRQSESVFTKPTAKDKYKGQIHAAAKCDMQFGKDKFIFMGRFRFGEAHLRCAPTYEDFLTVQKASKNKIPCT